MVDPNRETRADLEIDVTPDFFAAKKGGPVLEVAVAAATHPGKKRPRNEDHYAVVRRTRNCEMLVSNLPDENVAFVADHAWGVLVADGIGGARFGDVASQLAIETMLEAAGQATSWVMKFTDLDSPELRQRIAAYVDRIQEMFRKQAQSDPDRHDMGTTLTAAYLIPPDAILAHIGDSRVYLIREGILTQITKDQTLAQALVDSGAVDEGYNKFGNVLINSLGGGRENIKADVMHVKLQHGDRMLICTDGLSDLVEPESIATALSETDLQEACNQLVARALDEGGRDNITVVVCEIVAKDQ